MYFWRTDQLIEDLKQDKLNEGNFKNYYLCATILVLFSVFIITVSPEKNISMALASSVIQLGLLITFTNAIFKVNGGITGRDFLNRFIALYVPISIKILVVSILIFLSAEIVLKLLSESIQQNAMEMINLYKSDAIDLIYALLVYWRIYVAMKKVNS